MAIMLDGYGCIHMATCTTRLPNGCPCGILGVFRFVLGKFVTKWRKFNFAVKFILGRKSGKHAWPCAGLHETVQLLISRRSSLQQHNRTASQMLVWTYEVLSYTGKYGNNETDLVNY
jgi:hypothetical protein